MLMADMMQAVDPVYFCQKLDMSPDPWQKRTLRWAGKRLILNCSRQSGKSTISAVKALHRAIYYPESLILLVSPSLRQSSELFKKVNEVSRQAENVPAKTEDNRLSMTLENGSRIVSLPGKEGTVRGYSGASLIIIDESARVLDELYYSVRPMLSVSQGSLILMSTPFGKRGFFHKEWAEGGESWERIRITADECPRISEEFLAEELNALGEWWYRQEYHCAFMDTVDQLFGTDFINAAFSNDIEPLFEEGS